MAFLGIKVSDNVGQLLSQVNVPGEKTSPSEMHITLFYFENFSIDDVIKSLEVIFELTTNTKPFNVKTNMVSHFPGWGDKDDKKCAVIAKITSDDLHKFRDKLADDLDDANVEFSKTYKDYKPHITLSYSQEEPEDFDLPDPVEFTVSEITLWGGEEMNDKLIVDFPLSYDKTEKNSFLIKRIEMMEKIADNLLI